jgi:hypothetical protein
MYLMELEWRFWGLMHSKAIIWKTGTEPIPDTELHQIYPDNEQCPTLASWLTVTLQAYRESEPRNLN